MVEVCEVSELANGSPVRIPVSNRNQFINMAPQNAHPELGRRIRLIARVAWVSGAQRSLAGQTVYWYFIPGPANRAGLPVALQASFNSAGGGAMRTTSTTNAEGWTSTVEFYPSQYGGDSFLVAATENSGYAGGLSAGTYLVWRRLYYELDCMSRSSGGTYADRAATGTMVAQFATVFIELIASGADNSPAHRYLLSGTAAPAWTAGVRDGGGAPRYFHLVLVDTIAVEPSNQTCTITIPAGGNRVVFPASTFTLDPSAWFVSASYSQGANSGTLLVNRFPMTVEGAPATGDDKFVATINTSGLPINAAQPWSLTLTFTKWKGLSGLQTGPATILGMRWRERVFRASVADLGSSTLNTMMHEPAHAMGQASQTLPTGANNPTYYMLNPGGPHCNALSNRCLMYEANSTSIAMCANCCDSIRGRNLSSLPVYGTAPY